MSVVVGEAIVQSENQTQASPQIFHRHRNLATPRNATSGQPAKAGGQRDHLENLNAIAPHLQAARLTTAVRLWNRSVAASTLYVLLHAMMYAILKPLSMVPVHPASYAGKCTQILTLEHTAYMHEGIQAQRAREKERARERAKQRERGTQRRETTCSSLNTCIQRLPEFNSACDTRRHAYTPMHTSYPLPSCIHTCTHGPVHMCACVRVQANTHKLCILTSVALGQQRRCDSSSEDETAGVPLSGRFSWSRLAFGCTCSIHLGYPNSNHPLSKKSTGIYLREGLM